MQSLLNRRRNKMSSSSPLPRGPVMLPAENATSACDQQQRLSTGGSGSANEETSSERSVASASHSPVRPPPPHRSSSGPQMDDPTRAGTVPGSSSDSHRLLAKRSGSVVSLFSFKLGGTNATRSMSTLVDQQNASQDVAVGDSPNGSTATNNTSAIPSDNGHLSSVGTSTSGSFATLRKSSSATILRFTGRQHPSSESPRLEQVSSVSSQPGSPLISAQSSTPAIVVETQEATGGTNSSKFLPTDTIAKIKRKTKSILSFNERGENTPAAATASTPLSSRLSVASSTNHDTPPESPKRPSLMPRSHSAQNDVVQNTQSGGSDEPIVPGRPRSRTLTALEDEKKPAYKPMMASTNSSSSVIGSLLTASRFRIDKSDKLLDRKSLESDGRTSTSGSRSVGAPSPKPSTMPKDDIREPEEFESVEEYCESLNIKGGAMIQALSLSNNPLSFKALQHVISSTFNFQGDPVDMALRKFVMVVGLPREAQQIDRILECFAHTYHGDNPNIYDSEDHAYYIVFSLVILHTDFFNKNNKHKMQKSDYIKNTYVEHVAKDCLECFYDNITYTPFIHTDEDFTTSATVKRSSASKNAREKDDPYAWIIEDKLQSMRPNLGLLLEDPYRLVHVENEDQFRELRNDILNGTHIQMLSQRSRPGAFIDRPTDPGVIEIKVAKIGLLYRREAKRMIYSKSLWTKWGAILTPSKLYLFKDVAWIQRVLDSDDGKLVVPLEDFHPSLVFNTTEVVAFSSSPGDEASEDKPSFLWAGRGGECELFGADSLSDMQDWVVRINFAATFNTCHVGPEKTNVGAVEMRLQEVEKTLAEKQKHVEEQVRIGEQLRLLVPIQPRSRESLIYAAGRLSAKLKWHWGELNKFRCYEKMLRHELALRMQLVGRASQVSLEPLSEDIALKVDTETIPIEVTPANGIAKLDGPVANGDGLINDELAPEAIDESRIATVKADTDSDYVAEDRDSEGDSEEEDGGILLEKLATVVSSPHTSSVSLRADSLRGRQDIVRTDSQSFDEASFVSARSYTNSEKASDHSSPAKIAKPRLPLLDTQRVPKSIELVEEPWSPQESLAMTSSTSIEGTASMNVESGSLKPVNSSRETSSIVSAGSITNSIVADQQHSDEETKPITMKKQFRRSLRDPKRQHERRQSIKNDRSKTADNGRQPTRATSLVRNTSKDFLVKGKKFSVVEVNPEFAATPYHQRTSSLAFHEAILDNKKEVNKDEVLDNKHKGQESGANEKSID